MEPMRTNWVSQRQLQSQWCEGPAGEVGILCPGFSHSLGPGHQEEML